MTSASLALLRGGFTEDIMFVFSPAVHESPLFLNTSSSSVSTFESRAGAIIGEVYAGARPSSLGLLKPSEQDMARPPSLLGVHLLGISGAYSVSWQPARDVVQSSGGIEVIVPLLGQLSIHFETVRQEALKRGLSRDQATAHARHVVCGVGSAAATHDEIGASLSGSSTQLLIAPVTCPRVAAGVVSFGDGLAGVT